jgi:Flp pilus assembly protein TadG
MNREALNSTCFTPPLPPGEGWGEGERRCASPSQDGPGCTGEARRSFFRRTLDRFSSDSGAAAVSFILCFPIFLTIVAIIVQMALMVNAKLMVANAADSAARAAATSLPDGHPENVGHAAWLTLAPLSPQAATGIASEAAADADALKQMGVEVPPTFASRATYAKEATTVTWSPERDFAHESATEIEVKVTYRFRLTVPVAMRIVSANQETVAGVTGRFWDVSGTSKVHTAHGRKTRSDDYGVPR